MFLGSKCGREGRGGKIQKDKDGRQALVEVRSPYFMLIVQPPSFSLFHVSFQPPTLCIWAKDSQLPHNHGNRLGLREQAEDGGQF